MNVNARIQQLGLRLPKANTPVAAYVMAVQSTKLLFVSGHIPRADGKVLAGQLGATVGTQEGARAARAVALDILATMHEHLGDLERVTRIVKLLCLVNSTPTFTEHHLVANGCSELLNSVFEARGQHARSAFGVAQLPLGACVEIDLIAEID